MVLHPTALDAHAAWDLDGGSAYAPELIRLLEQPRAPDKAFRQSYGLPLLLFAIGLVIGTYCATVVGGNLFRIEQALTAGYRLEDTVSAVLALPEMPTTLVLTIVALGLILQASRLTLAEDQRAWREQLAYQQAQLRWEHAYYCATDDVVYIDGDLRVRSPERFGDLLWDGTPPAA